MPVPRWRLCEPELPARPGRRSAARGGRRRGARGPPLRRRRRGRPPRSSARPPPAPGRRGRARAPEPADGVDGVADVHQQLAALPRAMSGRATESKPAARKAAAIASAARRRGRRAAARCRGCRASGDTGQDDARLEVGRGHHHADPVRRLEQPQDRRLVVDPVLRRHHHGLRGRGPVRSSRAAAVWWLFTQSSTTVSASHSVSAAPATAGTGTASRPSDRSRTSPSRRMAAQVGSSRDQGDVCAGQVEVGADHAADGAGPVDEVPHPVRSARARTAPGAGTRRSATPRRSSAACPSSGRRRRPRARERPGSSGRTPATTRRRPP